ncbi:hypothetical protein A2810_03095 [candidate division Kazan bacterium RIFCSPHIGHO2_01_FULL_49_10]|uniref:Secondary thiamine-phosphate synthase enzyme n=1 Tax=candidate division Kazan bacterium RIFCSPLOWO2_01_FULL_48_13 TaxID=1798539 RepID=A0A1F4PPG4_UNCK3|nr:MAG: hypothetical protein A2810_03095 [candidate division Kazan bacterium RIFCSPHIGHO2_01_FULL_49_10]OGB85509.1 MAG: hypothetical protein A2994_00590 [candidate division Kazan bacterium RIFCSPLOWO2_01_FULL_48_13]
MRIVNQLVNLQSAATLDFIDITDQVAAEVANTGIQNGIVNVQSLHTTMAIVVNESEPLLISDMKKTLEEMAPQSRTYTHDDFTIRTVNLCDDECANGHAHNKALHLPTSAALNVVGGKLQLGVWQRVFAVELDRPRDRQVALQLIGE